jgi:acyl-CoA reductase-like NAD-dependent aldehyde dehydrogenase
VIVDENYPIASAASTVAWAKVYDGGQVCISPDYKLYPRVAGNPRYTAILNQRHYDRISGYITEAQASDLEVISVRIPSWAGNAGSFR